MMTPLTDTTTWPRWAAMWCLACAIYGLLKWWSWHRRTITAAPWWRHFAYLAAWPGMDADAFLDVNRSVDRPSLGERLFAAAKMAFGLIVLIAVVPRMAWASSLAVGWTGMIGLAFVLHFGLFHLLSCGWRSRGVCAVPIMQWPILSESVSAFWGRRWNLAFRDLTHRFVFRPLTRRLGAAAALFAGFVLSGLVHELVTTVPAGGGYGGPTAYFTLQGFAVMLEHSRIGRGLGLGHAIISRLFAMAVVILPVSLLFPRPFVCGLFVPFLEALGVAR